MRRENNFQESNFYDTFKRRDRGRLHWWIFVLVFRDLHALQTTSDIVIRVNMKDVRIKNGAGADTLPPPYSAFFKSCSVELVCCSAVKK